ncbi:heparan-sulfate 6-O-sulfotransferase 2 [Octopus vulgaris]|uniref:Heparan-sulfate 6-O-sulfotransferase n=1 Tax=Octopus vulgaris TaxID=6645 RepID=A0AA36B2E0_OCTVU|nr:heparan-sulfate 6-O-sulfotransferase 2 [Octopus vulgaris]
MVLFGVIVLGYFCPLGPSNFTPNRFFGAQTLILQQHSPPVALLHHIINNTVSNVDVSSDIIHLPLDTYNFSTSDLQRDFQLDMEKEDVIVFLHIQKTGGSTFGRHLVRNLVVDRPCECVHWRKRCNCLTHSHKNWLFSRFSTGWICGLHADWTELTECVEKALDKVEGSKRKRKYKYITFLRHPVHRYLSEWRHVFRGATWKSTNYRCNGNDATLEEVPFCYKGSNWRNVSLDSFLECPSNMAVNRQVRMLANLSKVNCYNRTEMSEKERNDIMLESAKENLLNMAFFGMTEFQLQSQKLFESTFHLNFHEDFEQYNYTRSNRVNLTWNQLVQITTLNKIDMIFYDFAKNLFFRRLEYLDKMNSRKSKRKRTGNNKEG